MQCVEEKTDLYYWQIINLPFEHNFTNEVSLYIKLHSCINCLYFRKTQK